MVDNGKYKSFPQRFPKARTTRSIRQNDIDWLLDGIDILLTLETPIEWQIFKIARKRGVKTMLMPMYECEPAPLPAWPDLILCPSLLDFDIFKKEGKDKCKVLYLPVPVNRKRIPFRQRYRAKVFQHNAGHGGLIGRNGTTELLAAIPMLKSEAKVLIYTQKKIDFVHPKVEIRVGNFENYWDIWGDGDIFIFPHKFDGLSLPINEALASGMPVISTAIYPFTTWLPKEWMFEKFENMSLRVWDRYIDVAVVPPEIIASKIDNWYGRNIVQDSVWAGELAEDFSWKNIKPKYLTIFKNLCKNDTVL